jgi:hypothetical protein
MTATRKSEPVGVVTVIPGAGEGFFSNVGITLGAAALSSLANREVGVLVEAAGEDVPQAMMLRKRSDTGSRVEEDRIDVSYLETSRRSGQNSCSAMHGVADASTLPRSGSVVRYGTLLGAYTRVP